MVAIQRKDNSMWAIPGGFVDRHEKSINALKREFIEDALNFTKGKSIFIFRVLNKLNIKIS